MFAPLGRGQDEPIMRLLPPVATAADAAPDFAMPDTVPTSAESGVLEADPAATVERDDVEQDLAGDETWYHWINPHTWSLPESWESSFEVGVDGSEGNARTMSFRTGANMKRKVDWSDLRVDVRYVRGGANGVETKHNGQLNANHDWLLGESPWSLFLKTQFEYNEFTAYDSRLTTNTGVGYNFLKTDSTQLKGRFGTGVSHEFNGPDDRWVPEAVFGANFEHRVSKRQKFRADIDYLPEWGAFNDYRVQTDIGWEFLLDEATNMSLKLGVVDRYDSTPNGRKPNDLDYSLLLLWKL